MINNEETNKDKKFISGRDIVEFLHSMKQDPSDFMCELKTINQKKPLAKTQVMFIYFDHDIKDKIIVFLN